MKLAIDQSYSGSWSKESQGILKNVHSLTETLLNRDSSPDHSCFIFYLFLPEQCICAASSLPKWSHSTCCDSFGWQHGSLDSCKTSCEECAHVFCSEIHIQIVPDMYLKSNDGNDDFNDFHSFIYHFLSVKYFKHTDFTQIIYVGSESVWIENKYKDFVRLVFPKLGTISYNRK